MNLYTCSIDLRNDAKAISFAHAVEQWMDHLMTKGVIHNWHLFRRKLNLASDNHRDFLLHIQVENLAQLDQAFRMLGEQDDHIETLYRAVHEQILQADFGLYRPFPDPERAERMALL
jgi:enoyl-[acyl-carrier-protein] reductase (NADH)